MANEPQKWASLLGSGADVNTIPDETPTGTGAASMKSIFPPITQVPLNAGGIAPDRADFNGLFKLLGDNIYYQQQGGVYSYSATIDYEKGSFVKHNDGLYVAVQENGPATVEKEPGEDPEYWQHLTTTVNGQYADSNGNVIVTHVSSADSATNANHATTVDKVKIKDGTITGIGAVGPSYRIFGNVPTGFNEDKHSGIFLAGTDNLKNIDSSKGAGDIIAIGDGVMSEGHPSSFNVGIGVFALHNVNGNYSSTGDRNCAVGSLGLFGVTTGRCNGSFGRDAGQPITTGSYNTALGYGSLGGHVPMGLAGKIEVQNPLTGDNNTTVGTHAGLILSGTSASNTLVGANSARNAKTATNLVGVGEGSLLYLGINSSINGKKLIRKTVSGTYSQSGNTITVTMNDHNAVVGCYVELRFDSGAIRTNYTSSDSQYLYVASVSGNTFTITSPTSLSASGNCTALAFEQSEAATENQGWSVALGSGAGKGLGSALYSVVVGDGAGACNKNLGSGTITNSEVIGGLSTDSAQTITNSTSIGYRSAGSSSTVSNNVSIGAFSGYLASEQDQNVLVGVRAGNLATTLQYSTLIGFKAGEKSSLIDAGVYLGRNTGNASTGESAYNTLIGHGSGQAFTQNFTQCSALGGIALSTMTDGSTTSENITRSTGVGFGARVSGSNQVQLGTTTETVYAYGAVQDRSDRRDKADIRDTVLGSDFIMALRPVDFKWDMRDDYIETITDDEGNSKVIKHKKDGSKKRSRYHHGFIAQEVKAVMDEQGVDFGGYQDHSVNGGNDILTLGYEELIAPMIKTIQEQNALIQALEKRIKALEAKFK